MSELSVSATSHEVSPIENKKEQVIEIPKELLDQNGASIKLSHSQAKQLLKLTRPKYPRTEAQIANTERLKALNKERFEKKRLEKELAMKKGMEEAKKAEMEHIEKKKKKSEKDNIKITVLPKEVRSKPLPPPPTDSESNESGSEDDISSEEEMVVKQQPKKVQKKVSTKEIKHKVKLLQEIDRVIQPNPLQARYSGLISKMF